MKTNRLNFTLALIASLLAAPLSGFAHNGVVHGDHDAHHGGFVMM